MKIERHIAQGFGKGELYDVLIALQLESGVLPTAGKTYFVSKQGNNTDGSSWASAYTTLEAAITASNTWVTTYVNVMNRIYVDGGNYTESLVAFPNHCEIIGVGTMSDGPRVNASTLIANAPSICHIYHMQFRTATAAPILDLGDTAQGVWLVDCLFNCVSGIQATIGVDVGDGGYYNKIINCRFIGTPSMTKGIVFSGAANAFCDIIGNEISAVTSGIEFTGNSAGSYSDYQIYIKDNVICRSDAQQGGDQLVTGISLLDSQSRSKIMIVHNWVAAATPFSGHSTNHCIENHVNIAGNGAVLVEEET